MRRATEFCGCDVFLRNSFLDVKSWLVVEREKEDPLLDIHLRPKLRTATSQVYRPRDVIPTGRRRYRGHCP